MLATTLQFVSFLASRSSAAFVPSDQALQPTDIDALPKLDPKEMVREAEEMAPHRDGDKPRRVQIGPEQSVDMREPNCLTLTSELCPPLNYSRLSVDEKRAVGKRCARIVPEERLGLIDAQPEKLRMCGRRLPRLNPCWEEGGVTTCLPNFFMLGEMKCGTTTLYNFLRRHPLVTVPKLKEPRFFAKGRFQTTTTSRWAYNFADAVSHPDSVTFDASPVYLRSNLAPFWLSRWMPHAKLIVLVRNPVSWLRETLSHTSSAPCTRRTPLPTCDHPLASHALCFSPWPVCAVVCVVCAGASRCSAHTPIGRWAWSGWRRHSFLRISRRCASQS